MSKKKAPSKQNVEKVSLLEASETVKNRELAYNSLGLVSEDEFEENVDIESAQSLFQPTLKKAPFKEAKKAPKRAPSKAVRLEFEDEFSDNELQLQENTAKNVAIESAQPLLQASKRSNYQGLGSFAVENVEALSEAKPRLIQRGNELQLQENTAKNVAIESAQPLLQASKRSNYQGLGSFAVENVEALSEAKPRLIQRGNELQLQENTAKNVAIESAQPLLQASKRSNYQGLGSFAVENVEALSEAKPRLIQRGAEVSRLSTLRLSQPRVYTPPKNYQEFKPAYDGMKASPALIRPEKFDVNSLGDYLLRANHLATGKSGGRGSQVILDVSGNEAMTDCAIAWAAAILKDKPERTSIEVVDLRGCHQITDSGLFYLTKFLPSTKLVNLTGFRDVTEMGLAHLFNGMKNLLAVEYNTEIIESVQIDKKILSSPSAIDISESMALPSVASAKASANPISLKAVVIGEKDDSLFKLLGKSSSDPVDALLNMKLEDKLLLNVFKCPSALSPLFMSNCCLCVLPYDADLDFETNVSQLSTRVINLASKHDSLAFLLVGVTPQSQKSDSDVMCKRIHDQMSQYLDNPSRQKIHNELVNKTSMPIKKQKVFGKLFKNFQHFQPIIHNIVITPSGESSQQGLMEALNKCSKEFLEKSVSFEALANRMKDYKKTLEFSDSKSIKHVYKELGLKYEKIYESKNNPSLMHKNMVVRMDALHMMGDCLNYRSRDNWYFVDGVAEFVKSVNTLISSPDSASIDDQTSAIRDIMYQLGLINFNSSLGLSGSKMPISNHPLTKFWPANPALNETEVKFTYKLAHSVPTTILSRVGTYLRSIVVMTYVKAAILEYGAITALLQLDTGDFGADSTLHVTYRFVLPPGAEDKKNDLKESYWLFMTRINTVVEFVLYEEGVYFNQTHNGGDPIIKFVEEHDYDHEDNPACIHCGQNSLENSLFKNMWRELHPAPFVDVVYNVMPRQKDLRGNILEIKSSVEMAVSTKMLLTHRQFQSLEFYLDNKVDITVSTTLRSGEKDKMCEIMDGQGHFEVVHTQGVEQANIILFRNGSVVATDNCEGSSVTFEVKVFSTLEDKSALFWKHTHGRSEINIPVEKGMRLEARDKKTPSLICVATVKDINHEEEKIQIYFDGWTDTYTYWTTFDDVDLHPIGWIDSMTIEYKKQKRLTKELQPPNKYKKPFTWESYLKEVNAEPIPYSFFKESQHLDCPVHPLLTSFTYGSGRSTQNVCKRNRNQIEVMTKLFEESRLGFDDPTLTTGIYAKISQSASFLILPCAKFTRETLACISLSELHLAKWRLPVCCSSLTVSQYHTVHASRDVLTEVNDQKEALNLLEQSLSTAIYLYYLFKSSKTQFLPTLWKPAMEREADYSLEQLHEDMCKLLKRQMFIMHVYELAGQHESKKEKDKEKPHICGYHQNTDIPYDSLKENFQAYGNVLQEVILLPKETVPDDLLSTCTALRVLEVRSQDEILDIQYLPNIAYCGRLEVLSIPHLNLKSLPGLDACRSTLKELTISNNPLYELPADVFSLTAIKTLTASNIGLETLSEDVGNLAGSLQNLELNNNSLSTLPQSITKLTNLEMLGVSGAIWLDKADESTVLSLDALKNFFMDNYAYRRIAERSSDGSEKFITEIFQQCDVNHKQILSTDEIHLLNMKLFNLCPRFGKNDSEPGFPSQILALKNLATLFLSYHAIAEIPIQLSTMTKLAELYLRHNPLLVTIPGEVSQLPIKAMTLRNCPSLKTPPREIVNRGLPTIMGYLRRLLTGSLMCKETKLMMVGLGGAGKTSLVDQLTGRRTNYDVPRVTDGIDIATWSVRLDSYGEEGQLTYSVWDFAGQTVYYNTHQFFLSDRAVYLLVWNMRLGFEHAGLDFWLSSINSHAPKAPILVVGTHADQVVRSDLPVKQLKKRFPQIAGFHYVSCFTGLNIDELQEHVIQTALQQPYMGEQIPAVWVKLRNKVIEEREQKKLNLIDITDMKNLASEVGIIDETEFKNAVTFLNDLGTIQRFSNQFLKSKVVVNPQWIVDVMACVVNVFESPITDGRFFHADIGAVWKKYPSDQHQWLLRLTEAFDLTFPLKGQNANLVPCLLSDSEPEFQWPEIEDLSGNIRETKMIFLFDYLPSGLFNRAQVRLYHFSDNSSLIWKTGAILKKGGQIALIKQTKDSANQLEVKVQGSHPDNMLYLIYDVFATLVKESFHGVHYDYQIPCLDCLKTSSYMEPCMIAASKIRRASELKATFLQCDSYFHTLSLPELHAVMPPDNSQDFDTQIERTVNNLKNLRLDMSTDFFMLYCGEDLPNGELITHIDPRRLKTDLEELGHKVWWSDNIKEVPDVALTLAIKDARAVMVLISKKFVQDKFYTDTLYRVRESHHKEVLLVVIESGWQEASAGFLTSDDVYVDMSSTDLYDVKLEEMMQMIQKRFSAQEEEVFPECFISYCWSNSKDAVSQGVPEVRGGLGWYDPRDLKKLIEDAGVPCWMDIERVGNTGGLFEDIAKGLRKAKVVIACVSDQYAESKNCQMEFRFAVKVLKLPVILAVVGKGVKWVTTEVGMLSTDLPRVSLMTEDQSALDELVSMVKEKLPVVSEKPVQKDDSKEFALNELIELAQRNFLRQAAGFAASAELSPYPRLFVLDFLEETSSNETLKIADENMDAQTADATEQDQKGIFCIRELCEHEDGWHISGTPISLSLLLAPEQTFDDFLKSIAGYMYRMLTVLKYSASDLPIFYLPAGREVYSQLEKVATVDKDFKTDYMHLRRKIMDFESRRGLQENFGLLDRCHLRSGNIVWLCKEHQASIGDVTILESEQGVASGGGESNSDDVFLELLLKSMGKAPTVESMINEFNGKAKAKGKFKGAIIAAQANNVNKKMKALKLANDRENKASGSSDQQGSGTGNKSKACVIQ